MRQQIHPPPRGTTLIEVMAASSIVLIAILGLTSAHLAATRQLSGASRQAEATALAQDLASLLSSIPYNTSTGSGTNALFANVSVTNDNDVTDLAGQLDQTSVSDPVSAGLADHAESELSAGQYNQALTPANATTPNGAITVYRRYWNIRNIPDPFGAGVAGVVIAAIVRYQVNGVYKHVSVVTTRFDPTRFRG